MAEDDRGDGRLSLRMVGAPEDWDAAVSTEGGRSELPESAGEFDDLVEVVAGMSGSVGSSGVTDDGGALGDMRSGVGRAVGGNVDARDQSLIMKVRSP